METRRVQITGGATFMVTLPKDWAEKQRLHAGAEIELHPHGSDLLILRPHRDAQPTRGVLTLDAKTGDALMRAFVSMYVAGFDIIEVKGERITPDQRQTIRKVTQALIGPEIMEESRDSIVVHNLLNLSELSAPKTLDRIFLMGHDMFSDAVRAVAEHDAELARDIVARDEDVDRLYLMLYRQFRIVLSDLLAEEAVSRLKLFDAHTVARQLERVADHAVKIAHVTTSLAAQPPHRVAEALRRSGDQVAALLRDSVDAFRAANPDRANDVIDTALGLEERLMKAVRLLWDLDPHGAQLIGIAFDSIRRVRDYSINIAETALNTAVPIP